MSSGFSSAAAGGGGGLFTTAKNSFVNITGNNNTGTVEKNSTSKINCEHCQLNVNGNSNCLIDLLRSTLKLSTSSNANIKGKDNHLDFNKESNLLFTGDGNNCFFDKNSNTHFEGNNSSSCTLSGNSCTKISGDRIGIKAINNSNLKITGNENVVKADHNSNMMVSGDFNDVNAFSTHNHAFVRAPTNSNVNAVTLTTSQSIQQVEEELGGGVGARVMSFFTSRLGQTKPSLRYHIEYVKRAEVINRNYFLGIFKFEVKDNQNYVDMNIDKTGMEEFRTTQVHPNQILIEGRRANEKEQLKLSGPRVDLDSSTDQGQANIRIHFQENSQL